MVYEDFKVQLINDFETRRDMLVVQDRTGKAESLFGIRDENDRLYMRILQAFELITIKNVEKLITKICKEKNIYCEPNKTHTYYYDLEVDFNGIRTYVDLKSQIICSSKVGEIITRNQEIQNTYAIVFLVKDSINSRKELSIYGNMVNKRSSAEIQCILFEDFIESLFGKEEKVAFQEAMSNFKQEMHKAIGYQITELCSPYNLESLRRELDKEICAYNYDTIREKRLAEFVTGTENFCDLNTSNFNIVKNVFINHGRYHLLLGDSDFAESYVTSEWLYKKYFVLDELDNTFIVAGYLKSIEQLLWDIVFIVGQGRSIKNMPISEENTNDIDTTLGALQYFLNNWENDDLFQNSFGDKKHSVMEFLKLQISDWRKKYRNGYFHKHNLDDKAKIEAIREETYFLYLLILGTIKLTPCDIRRLEQ